MGHPRSVISPRTKSLKRTLKREGAELSYCKIMLNPKYFLFETTVKKSDPMAFSYTAVVLTKNSLAINKLRGVQPFLHIVKNQF